MIKLSLLLFAILFQFSVLSFAQERTSRNSDDFTYSGVFKFTRQDVNEDSLIDWTKFDALLSLGTRYHRYDPIRKSDKATTSSFSDQSYYAGISLEYRFFNFVSLIGSHAWEWQQVARYDGIDLENKKISTQESHLGLQINYDPFFISYEVGKWDLPHFYLGSSDEFLREDLNVDVTIVRAGFRRNISDTLSLNFSADHTQFKDFQNANLGRASGESFGLSIFLLHNSGFGLRLREEEGKVSSDNYKYEFNSFSILPFVSFL